MKIKVKALLPSCEGIRLSNWAHSDAAFKERKNTVITAAALKNVVLLKNSAGKQIPAFPVLIWQNTTTL